MNGRGVLLDTNAFIYFFEGRGRITNLVLNTPEIFFSIISEIEILSAQQLTQAEIVQIQSFLSLCRKVDLTSEIVAQAIVVRRQYHLKTPDAIVAASALSLNIPLASADTGFHKVAGLALISDILA